LLEYLGKGLVRHVFSSGKSIFERYFFTRNDSSSAKAPFSKGQFSWISRGKNAVFRGEKTHF
jgi:hypothetical protein